MSQVLDQPLAAWDPRPDAAPDAALVVAVEAGKVLLFPHLDFDLSVGERRFLDPRWSDGRAKNISFDPAQDTLKGATGNRADLDELKAMLARYHGRALGLIRVLFPRYVGHLRIAPTSFRPMPVAGRSTSWRKDDSRLHIDAFPSRPNRGERILRVFTNVNPKGEPRVWRVGEPFDDLAKRMLPKLPAQIPGSAALLAALHITKSPRSAYDHTMLALHDRMKADLDYQRTAPQETVPFAPGSTWVCFSDQTSHAVMSGQFMFEQTLHLPVEAMYEPTRSPLKTLERLVGKALA